MTRKLAFLLPLGAAFAFAACSDDTGGTTTSESGASSSSSTSSSSTGSSSGMGGAGGASASTSSSSGMGGAGGASGACTNATDAAVLASPTIQADVGACGQNNILDPAKRLACIKGLGFTDGCAMCFDDTVGCAISKCLNECAANPMAQACVDCRKAKCDPAFAMCSGLMP